MHNSVSQLFLSDFQSNIAFVWFYLVNSLSHILRLPSCLQGHGPVDEFPYMDLPHLQSIFFNSYKQFRSATKAVLVSSLSKTKIKCIFWSTLHVAVLPMQPKLNKIQLLHIQILYMIVAYRLSRKIIGAIEYHVVKWQYYSDSQLTLIIALNIHLCSFLFFPTGWTMTTRHQQIHSIYSAEMKM